MVAGCVSAVAVRAAPAYPRFDLGRHHRGSAAIKSCRADETAHQGGDAMCWRASFAIGVRKCCPLNSGIRVSAAACVRDRNADAEQRLREGPNLMRDGNAK